MLSGANIASPQAALYIYHQCICTAVANFAYMKAITGNTHQFPHF
jgi:hypothetical protein